MADFLTPMAGVRVTARARLHMGFLDMNGGLGRRFGSIGMALDSPVTRLSLRFASGKTNHASGMEVGRVLEGLTRLCAKHGIERAFDVEVEKAIPAHAGLGSGTQLSLALGAAFRTLNRIIRDTRADANLLERGARSGIGAALFDLGGLVVDGGRGAHTLVPPVLARLSFPREWRVILLMDSQTIGIHGDAERAAFQNLPAFSAIAVGEICRLILVQALPALAEHNIAGFGSAITQVQALMGDHFAPAQGGRFTSAKVSRALTTLQNAGAAGFGQSSWGPTGFAFVSNKAEAHRILALQTVKFACEGLHVQLCKAHDGRARVERFDAPD